MHTNVDQEEINKFGALAAQWWDLNGSMKPLHQLNPLRLAFIKQYVHLKNNTVCDIGCGGGILTEALAKEGATTFGIDLSEAALEVAKQHAELQNLTINYQTISAEELAADHPAEFDVITCMEMLEHVPDPSSIIQACAFMTKPGGTLFFSTINRNVKSFVKAIIGAEYILQLLPKGTHHYSKFIRPSELTHWCEQAGLKLKALQGIDYSPLRGEFQLSRDINVNYLACYEK